MTKYVSFFLVLVFVTSLTVSSPILAQDYNIPKWIKNNAKWWSEGIIKDSDFVNGIQHLVQNGIIVIENLETKENAMRWMPEPNTTWQWQLDGDIDLSHNVKMYDLDLFDTDVDTINSLHKKGIVVICYISVGSWEEWRPDAVEFSLDVIGKNYSEWQGERWLDIRKLDEIGPIIEKRLDLCKSKGFDGVEPDNVDGYSNDTGFPLTYEDQLQFNIWLAQEAHQRGLSIGLKNDPEQSKDLLPYFDWALTEDCFVDNWCDMLEPFTKAGKAVFQAEYTDNNVTLDQFCPQSIKLEFSGILKDRDLTSWRLSCIT